MKTVVEFIIFFIREFTRWLGSSHRVSAAPSADAEFDWRSVGFIGHVDRKTWELLALVLVGFPLLGYLFSKFVPFIMKFWTAQYR